MILRKCNEGEDILGLKVVGGQVLSSGRIGAIIEKVKRGSIADQEGHIRPGNLKQSHEVFSTECAERFVFLTWHIYEDLFSFRWQLMSLKENIFSAD